MDLTTESKPRRASFNGPQERRQKRSNDGRAPAGKRKAATHAISSSDGRAPAGNRKVATHAAGFKIYCDMHTTLHDDAKNGQLRNFSSTLGTSDKFLEQTKTPTTFTSSEEFSLIAQHLEEMHSQLIVPSALQVNWRVFRQGVSPCWEDPANSEGGKWAMSFVGVGPSEILARLNTVMTAIIDGSFPNNRLVNGVVLSVKEWGYRLSIWVGRVPAKGAIARGCQWLRAQVQPKYTGFYTHHKLAPRAPLSNGHPVPCVNRSQSAGSTSGAAESSGAESSLCSPVSDSVLLGIGTDADLSDSSVSSTLATSRLAAPYHTPPESDGAPPHVCVCAWLLICMHDH